LPVFGVAFIRLAQSSTAGRRLQNGTTYNSYLIFGEDKTALVDVSHEKFRSLYMKTLREQLAKAGRTVDYVIVSHTEPDHSGASCSCDDAAVPAWQCAVS